VNPTLEPNPENRVFRGSILRDRPFSAADLCVTQTEGYAICQAGYDRERKRPENKGPRMKAPGIKGRVT